MANLRLDTQEGALAPRKNGVAIVPGKPDESLLIKRIYSDNPGFRMPPVFAHKTLTDDQKETIRRWIEQGAKFTRHWAFVAPVKSTPPAVKDARWPHNDIDRFVLAKMESNGLEPAPEVDRRTLIRRVTLDLTGLPPTPAEVQAFVKDGSPDAYERVVDRLLASAHFGEHRARYWLDAARYADTNGFHFDNYREIWPYRDWVINAFNRNEPFDQFTVEQLAGDLLPHGTLDQKIASGFVRAGETTDEGGAILPEVEAMYAKDRADTMGTVWMGLTVGCATCHDHKFDPITQKDYYSLTSFFRNSTQPIMDQNLPDTPPVVFVPPAADRKRWDELTTERQHLRDQLATERSRELGQIQAWIASFPAPNTDGDVLANSTVHNVNTIDAPALDGKALQFTKDSSLEVNNAPRVDSDRPFSIATWIYIPELKEDCTVASQLDTLPGSKPGEKKHRGWKVRLDTGNLGLYSRAPTLYLVGDDGEQVSERPLTEMVFKPNTWYHAVFVYDGSRRQYGLSMYINGEPVHSVGRGDQARVLSGSIATQAPLLFGREGEKSFEGGAISDFRFFDRALDDEDARLLYIDTRVRASQHKQQKDLTGDERTALSEYYVLTADSAEKDLVKKLRADDQEFAAIRSRSATSLVMQERTDTLPVAHVLYRGQYDQMRDEVHPITPAILPPMKPDMPRNRLGLAMWMVDPSNPLTARVTVNRFWQEIFGVGIVKTTEDFGSQGEPPSNPQLLDWLAVDFRDSGWNVKRLFKEIVMSSTYRQSALTTPDKIAKDPDNRLLSRGPRFRMDGEMVRDTALYASGLLKPDIGGPSVKPYQPKNVWETVAMDQSNTRVYKQDQGDALYRRSIYTFWKRAAPPPSLDIFNAPSREGCTVRRERTDTPLQALVTMNDPQFVEAARVLAQNAMEAQKRLDKAVDYMAERLLARPLDKEERALVDKSYQDFLDYYSNAPQDAAKLLSVGQAKLNSNLPKPQIAAMTMVANEIMNTDEVLNK